MDEILSAGVVDSGPPEFQQMFGNIVRYVLTIAVPNRNVGERPSLAETRYSYFRDLLNRLAEKADSDETRFTAHDFKLENGSYLFFGDKLHKTFVAFAIRNDGALLRGDLEQLPSTTNIRLEALGWEKSPIEWARRSSLVICSESLVRFGRSNVGVRVPQK